MSTETDRKVFGVGLRGEVVLITKQEKQEDAYIVRMGAHTMHESKDKKAAEAIAKALVA